MAYLLYGIVKAPDSLKQDVSLTGVKSKPVIFVEAHGLCAAVSEQDVEEGAPPVAELLTYARVVEALHCRQTVIPMRYGCFLNSIQAINDILKVRQNQYGSLLAELDGHVEMGIRLILPIKECKDILPGASTLLQAESAIDGRAYLANRKVQYQMQEEITQDRQALIDLYTQAFSGLSSKHRTETAVKSGTLVVSLYFLTPGSDVIRFRETFGGMMAKGNDGAMLSGPWPPYNFVTTDIGKYGDVIHT